jgi:hypothetical protein
LSYQGALLSGIAIMTSRTSGQETSWNVNKSESGSGWIVLCRGISGNQCSWASSAEACNWAAFPLPWSQRVFIFAWFEYTLWWNWRGFSGSHSTHNFQNWKERVDSCRL